MRCEQTWGSSSTHALCVARAEVMCSGCAEFLSGLGFGKIQRALITKAGQETEIIEEDGRVRIVTSDIRGATELALPLGGAGVKAKDGDGGAEVCRAATLERGALPPPAGAVKRRRRPPRLWLPNDDSHRRQSPLARAHSAHSRGRKVRL